MLVVDVADPESELMITAELFVRNGGDYSDVGLGDAVLVGEHGIDRLRVSAPAEALVARVREIVEGLGIEVLRVAPGVVSVPELAGLTGVERDEVRKWTRRAGFPTVFGNLRGHKIWLLEELVGWFDAQGIELAYRPPTREQRAELESALGLDG